MPRFTIDDVMAAMQAVVAEKGEDYVYPHAGPGGMDCVYAEDGMPSCIVGHVIYRLDPKEFAKVVELENRSGSAPATSLQDEGYISKGMFDDETEQFLYHAQSQQDAGKTWGEALSRAYFAVM